MIWALIIVALSASAPCYCKMQAHGTEWSCEPKTCTQALNISLVGTNATRVSFPGVTAINNLYIQNNNALTTVSMPDNTKTYNLVVSKNPKLEGIEAPKLEQVSTIWVDSKKVSFPILLKAKTIRVVSSEVEVLKFPMLNYTQSLLITQCYKLTSILLPHLFYVDYFLSITNNSILDLIQIDNAHVIKELVVESNTRLGSFNIPKAPTLTKVRIAHNPALQQFAARDITHISDLVITNNHILSEVSLPAYAYADNVQVEGLLLKPPACVRLSCFRNNVKSFQVFWCGKVNSTAPLCSHHASWDCKC